MLLLKANNKVELLRMQPFKEKIEKFYRSVGYKEEIPIIIEHEENEVYEAIQKDLEVSPLLFKQKDAHLDNKEKEEGSNPPKQIYPKRRKKTPDEGCVLGSTITQNPFPISSIQNEDDNVVLDGYIFGTEYFESPKSNVRIITFKDIPKMTLFQKSWC